MYVATLLTHPDHPVLERVTVESLRNAWGGGDAVWLDPGVAAEFPIEAVPANQWDVWAALQALRVDLILQPAQGRKKRLLLADMDSTMIEQECIDELADEAGVGALVAGITARAMNGELDFEASASVVFGNKTGSSSLLSSRENDCKIKEISLSSISFSLE